MINKLNYHLNFFVLMVNDEMMNTKPKPNIHLSGDHTHHQLTLSFFSNNYVVN